MKKQATEKIKLWNGIVNIIYEKIIVEKIWYYKVH